LFKKPILSLIVLASLTTILACSSSGETSQASQGGTVSLSLGYFPNVTHSQPIVGLARGTYAEDLGPNVKLDTKLFNAGPAAIEALLAGQIDAAYVGPNPAINGYVQSNGSALRIVAGAASAGALLIVRPDRNIKQPSDFVNKKVATPQLGNTQDVALRAWLKSNGLNAKENGGNVTVLPTSNSDTLNLFKKGDIDAAWVPEPWASRLVREAGGKVFLDERSLWPNGDFVTTHLVVRTSFLKDHPDVVESLVKANVEITQWIVENPAEAKRIVNDGIKQLTGAALGQEVLDDSWSHMKVTYDPIASSLRQSAEEAYSLGFLGTRKPDLANIYALDPLNKVLAAKGLPAVAG